MCCPGTLGPALVHGALEMPATLPQRLPYAMQWPSGMALLHKGAVATESSLIRYGIRRSARTLAFQERSCDSMSRI